MTAAFSFRPHGEPTVSILLPLFGRHRGIETLPAVARAWLDQDVPCEVVVGAAADAHVSLVRDAALPSDVRLIECPRSASAPGVLRNLAAQAARSRLLYLSDADIAPVGRDFLRRALDLTDGSRRVVAQPWMHRLLPGEGQLGVRSWQPPAARACYVTSGQDGALKPLPIQRFTTLGGVGLAVGPPRADGQPESWHERLQPCFHWGGLLTDRELFEAVGRYCPRYTGWGCEDDDLLIKLSSRRETLYAWRTTPDLTCLHFEHPRPEGNADSPNRVLLAQRAEMGADAMIRADARAQRA